MRTFLTLLLLLFTAIPSILSTFPDHFFKPKATQSSGKTREYFELARPSPYDRLTPSCTLHIIHHYFANTINKPPFSIPYSPPSDCSSPPWSHVTLEFRAKSRGDQYDRISGLWLGGAELLRTSTAEPTRNGIFWKVRKDITRYSSLLAQKNLTFTIMLENVVNNVYDGVYRIDVHIFFYKDNNNAVSVPLIGNNLITILPKQEANSVYESPADLIIPISSDNGYNKGYWFVIEGESQVQFKKLSFPVNTHKAVLELYVSFHGNDEFWYSNPSNSYLRVNNLTTLRGNGAYREVFVTIDGRIVGSESPFPVIFTGGINPLFWEPVVAIGAFNLPSYDFDLTPFLEILLDGKDHVFGVGVSDGISYWLVDANLHLWLDYGANSVIAKSVVYTNPVSFIRREEEFKLLDGSFAIKAKRRMKMVGWVKSSVGNLTTSVFHDFKLKSSMRFAKNGNFKYVKQKIKSKREVRVLNDVGGLISRLVVKRKYPLKVITLNLPGSRKDTYMLVTNVSHSLTERAVNREFSTSVYNNQVSNGWMEVKDHDVVKGEAVTNQTLSSRDRFGCYIWTVAAINGRLVTNNTTYVCPSVM